MLKFHSTCRLFYFRREDCCFLLVMNDFSSDQEVRTCACNVRFVTTIKQSSNATFHMVIDESISFL